MGMRGRWSGFTRGWERGILVDTEENNSVTQKKVMSVYTGGLNKGEELVVVKTNKTEMRELDRNMRL